MDDYCAVSVNIEQVQRKGPWARLNDATERVRGRWVISWQAYTIGVVLHVVLVAGTGGSLGAEPTNPRQSPYWLLLAVIASLAVGGYALVVNYTAFRNKRTQLVPLWQAVAFHVGVGCIFAFTLLFGSTRLPVTSIEGPVGFVIATIAIGVWFGFTMSFILEARERYHLERAALIEEAVVVQLASIAETEALARLTTTFTSRLAEPLAELEPIRDELNDRLETIRGGVREVAIDASWRAVAHRLREASDESIRPLSRELWRITEDRYPNPSWREVLVDTLRHPIAWPAPTAVIVVIGYLRASMTSLGVIAGIAVTVAMAALIAAVLRRSAAPRRSGGAAFWLAFVFAQLLGVAVVVLGTPGSAPLAPEIIGSVVAMTISVFGPATIATLNGARDSVLMRLRTDAARERINQIAEGRHLARLARETATHLHGTVQTSLIACAAAIEQAVDRDDHARLIEAMERVIEVGQAATNAPVADVSTVRTGVQATAAAWQGLLDVQCFVDESIANVSGKAAQRTARIVEECLANAARHGDASSVRVSLRAHDDGIEVVIEDDGHGMDVTEAVLLQGRAGLGTAVLMEATQGQVHFEPVAAGQARPGLRVLAIVSSGASDTTASMRSTSTMTP